LLPSVSGPEGGKKFSSRARCGGAADAKLRGQKAAPAKPARTRLSAQVSLSVELQDTGRVLAGVGWAVRLVSRTDPPCDAKAPTALLRDALPDRVLVPRPCS
jgi:hypothetical protein